MADPVFIAIAVLTIGTAIIALEARELIYGAISLAISMLGICRLFPFIRRAIRGNVQIAVYVGAVAVFIIFTVMLVRTQSALYYKGRQKEKGRRYCTHADNNVKFWGPSACLRAQWPV